MSDAAWIFVSLVYLTAYFEFRTWRRSRENIEKLAKDTLSNLAKNLVLVSTPSLHKSEVTHIFKLSEPPQASTN